MDVFRGVRTMNVAIVDHHLNNYHADKFLGLLHGPLADEDVKITAAWEYYGVHTIAMALRIMGSNVKRGIDTGTGTARTVTLDFGANRRAVMDVRTAENEWDEFNWRFAFRSGDRYVSADIRDYDGF